MLKCNAVHIFSAPAIFAKYGTSADAALEAMLHEVVLRGAMQSSSSHESPVARICIVLDHFETFINCGTNIDSYTSVLNSMCESIYVVCIPYNNLNPMHYDHYYVLMLQHRTWTDYLPC